MPYGTVYGAVYEGNMAGSYDDIYDDIYTADAVSGIGWRVRDLTVNDATPVTTAAWRVRDLFVGNAPATTGWRVRTLSATGVTAYPLQFDDIDGLYEPGQTVNITRNISGTPDWSIAAVSAGPTPTLNTVGDLAYFTAPATLTGTRITVTDGTNFIEVPIMAVTERTETGPVVLHVMS